MSNKSGVKQKQISKEVQEDISHRMSEEYLINHAALPGERERQLGICLEELLRNKVILPGELLTIRADVKLITQVLEGLMDGMAEEACP